MKYLLVLILPALSLAGSDHLGFVHPSGPGHGGPTDAIVFDQGYSFAALVNGYQHIQMADDFILSADASIQNIRMWVIYVSTPPTSYDLAIAQDNGDSDPNTATTIWSENVPCTHVDTGDDQWGYDIWETTFEISETDVYPSLTAGVRYWLIFNFTATEYWLVEDPVWGSYAWTSDGSTWYRTDSPSTFDYAADAFFQLYDTPVALDRETWANIKTMF
ncbi:MAG: hypothetical protein AVO35_06125 [Candidatus Aegiribacteria sp. MLS_C]|nr:MAG: hypothetical protein AVO35_06125 [Candidatus Aegiribacteria sp. MLS_C]